MCYFSIQTNMFISMYIYYLEHLALWDSLFPVSSSQTLTLDQKCTLYKYGQPIFADKKWLKIPMKCKRFSLRFVIGYPVGKVLLYPLLPAFLVRQRVHLPLRVSLQSKVLNLTLKSFCGAVAISYRKTHFGCRLIDRRQTKADKDTFPDVLALK